MADITLNSAVRANLRTLQSTTDLMNRTEERLSTGKKVNSALDNPSSFFTSQSLERRAGDLSSLLDSVSTSVKTLQAADNGISAISKVVEGLKATARAALQSPSAVATKANVESASVTGLTAGNIIGSAGGAPTAGEVSFTFGGPTSFSVIQAIQFDINIDGTPYNGAGINQGHVDTYGNGNDGVISSAAEFRQILTGFFVSLPVTIGGTGNAVTITSNTTGASSGVAVTNYQARNGLVDNTGFGNASGTGTAGGGGNEGKTLTVKDRSGADKTVTLSANGVNTLDELNDWLDENDVALKASVTSSGGSGKLKLEAANSAAYTTPADIAGTITDAGGSFAADQTFSAPVLDPEGAARRAAFVKDYNDALKQISSLAKDASFNGANLLMGDDLDVTFNEDGTSFLNVIGATFDAAGLGLAALGDDEFHDGDSINGTLDDLEAVFGKLERQASKFGSQLQIVNTRESFAKDMIGTLEDGAAALTSADTNEEAANLATLQTRQQLIVSALSISTSQEQNILQLLR